MHPKGAAKCDGDFIVREQVGYVEVLQGLRNPAQIQIGGTHVFQSKRVFGSGKAGSLKLKERPGIIALILQDSSAFVVCEPIVGAQLEDSLERILRVIPAVVLRQRKGGLAINV